jgi:two-component system alkaline phosphatase synthesis response regulator PhoP
MGKILIVEDEANIRQLVRYNLEKAGFQVMEAVDGAQGLQSAQREKPDLVLLDLMLPELDGLEVCRSLKGNPTTAALPIIMLTAKAEEVDKIIGLELGADDYMTKPFSPRNSPPASRPCCGAARRKPPCPASCRWVGYGSIFRDTK